MTRNILRRAATLTVAALMAGAGVARAADPVVTDPHLKRWIEMAPARPPIPPVPGRDYGMDAQGRFQPPKATPLTHEAPAFPGQLTGWDAKSYAKNVDVLAFYPHVGSPWHAWIEVADFNGRRFMYVHDRDYLTVLDVTDPSKAAVVYRRGGVWGRDGASEPFDAAGVKDYFGGVTIAWNKALGKNVLVASYEIGRFGLMQDKTREPDKVAAQRRYSSLKGFRVYVMDGPLPNQWRLIATRTTDIAHPNAPVGAQQGSGSLDAVNWSGGRYMLLSAAPDDRYVLTEYPDYLYSPGYQVWDMANPAKPTFVSQITVPGQVVGDAKSEAAYLANPRAGNRTSWMGSRTPPVTPTPIEAGGKLAIGGMGGLGLYTFDISNPARPKVLGHFNQEPSFAGTEFDNVDASQYARTGVVFTNGYPMNANCYEPAKDILAIDVSRPASPRLVAKFPRPTPPADAGFTDYCQRRGSFGPKRSGGAGQPGHSRDGLVIYAYYTAGVQLFDVTEPAAPKIAGYFAPRFPTTNELPEYTFENTTFAVFTEYDRNVIWAFTTNGVYALSSPLLGTVKPGSPAKVWPPRR